ncbi:MAG: hypothetical protein KDD47_27660, partial [Acidobacteria bacterium]|nr:hypothetical protein [Acidobacteriota bacterium]
MDEALYRRVKEVVARVLDLEEGERGRYLAEVCGGDPDLRREVARLLAEEETSSEGFLHRPLELGPTTAREEGGG